VTPASRSSPTVDLLLSAVTVFVFMVLPLLSLRRRRVS